MQFIVIHMLEKEDRWVPIRSSTLRNELGCPRVIHWRKLPLIGKNGITAILLKAILLKDVTPLDLGIRTILGLEAPWKLTRLEDFCFLCIIEWGVLVLNLSEILLWSLGLVIEVSFSAVTGGGSGIFPRCGISNQALIVSFISLYHSCHFLHWSVFTPHSSLSLWLLLRMTPFWYCFLCQDVLFGG